MDFSRAPGRDEAAEFYFTYIDKVPPGDIRETLERQAGEAPELLGSVSEEGSLHRYAPGKWSLREVASHVADAERLFSFRAFWFARGFEEPLPSFDQEFAMRFAGADARPWHDHLEELRAVRAASVSLFRGLPAEAWERRGVASGNPITVRALAWIVAGHLAHHLGLVRERYL